jgi:hypothetical protein
MAARELWRNRRAHSVHDPIRVEEDLSVDHVRRQAEV